MNWDTAPQELDALRAQVAALTKELEIVRFGNAFKYGTSHPELYKTSLDDCREQLATMTKERDRWQQAYERCNEVCKATEECWNADLAAAQAQSALDARLKKEYDRGYVDAMLECEK
jgi:hypothetical protein